jgi:hypothetical protein
MDIALLCDAMSGLLCLCLPDAGVPLSVPVTDRRASLHRVPTSVPLLRCNFISGEVQYLYTFSVPCISMFPRPTAEYTVLYIDLLLNDYFVLCDLEESR